MSETGGSTLLPSADLMLEAARRVTTTSPSLEDVGDFLCGVQARTRELFPRERRAEILHAVARAACTIFPNVRPDLVTEFFIVQAGAEYLERQLEGTQFRVRDCGNRLDGGRHYVVAKEGPALRRVDELRRAGVDFDIMAAPVPLLGAFAVALITGEEREEIDPAAHAAYN